VRDYSGLSGQVMLKMNSGKFAIEKLDDDNYSAWAIQMKSVLKHTELWPVVCRTKCAVRRQRRETDCEHHAVATNNELAQEMWCLDSGATAHLCCARSMFIECCENKENK